MTSMPASRSARAMILAPRSWPSRPGLATTTRMFWVARGAGIRRRGILCARGPRRRRGPGGPRDGDGRPGASADAQAQRHAGGDVAHDRAAPRAREAAPNDTFAADAGDRAALRPRLDANVVRQVAGPPEADGI